MACVFLRGGASTLFSCGRMQQMRSPVVSLSARFTSTMTSSTPAAFSKEGVVPDVIPKAPENQLTVEFDSGVKAELGNTLTPTQVKNQPKVSWEAADRELYTVIKTDPDAPSRKEPTHREWHHWLVVNIPGNDVSKGETLAEYVGAGPPPGTGLHRYVYMVYQQPGGKQISDPEHGHLTNRSGEKRGGFKTAAFVQKHGLGEPVAGNFFLAEYDDYVPALYKQLGA